MRYVVTSLVVAVAAAGNAQVAMEPFVMDWRDNAAALVDLSSLLNAPAGKDGAIGISDGHLATPEGRRFRIWGVNFRIWGVNVTGSACFPSKEDAPAVAGYLARFGINCVRFHFLDSNWSASLFVKGRDDTRALDPKQLDRLDTFVAELKKRGIYTNLNLNVGRNYRKDDGVRDYEYLGMAKVVNYFDRRVRELHEEYARQLLTHVNPYTKAQYRHEPAVAIVELVNENSLVEAWFSDRLLGKNAKKRPGTWTDITPWYADQLTRVYNEWLTETLSGEKLNELRRAAGIGQSQPVPRLTRAKFEKAPALQFHTEARFYMHLERQYFQGMYDYLKNDLGVKSLIVGTSDHNHWRSGYPLLSSTSLCDVVDGHVYWQHPSYSTDRETGNRTFWIPNTAMVADPVHSTIVQLARSAVEGKPYTVSETNHPFPNEYACEGIGILAAYGALHDWDGVFFYTLEHKTPADWDRRMPGHFDIRPDPVKMANLAAGACMFLRGDVLAAKQTVYRSYTPAQVRESIRHPSSERPFFTPGFDPATALVHSTRIRSFEQSGGPYPQVDASSAIVSDTGQLAWHQGGVERSFVTVQTDRSQACTGFMKDVREPLRNLAATVDNEFCSIVLTSLDGKPISTAERLLLVTTARSANTGMEWNDKRTTLAHWGTRPTVIEPVTGSVTLKNLETAQRIEAVPLDGAGGLLASAIPATKSAEGYQIRLGQPATPWYLIRVSR